MGNPLNPFDPENKQPGMISGIINDNTNTANPSLGVNNPNTPMIPQAPGMISGMLGTTGINPSGWNSDAVERQKAEYQKMLEAYRPTTSMVSNPVIPPTPAPTVPTAPVTLPGYMQGETKEQRRARIRKNRLAKGEIT